jgi:hypothetical protein
VIVGMTALPARADGGSVSPPPPITVVIVPRDANTLPTPPSLTALLNIARSALDKQNDYMVTGTAGSAPQAFAAWLASERANLDRRRTALNTAGIAYTSHTESFTGAALSTNGALATVVADVDTHFAMAGINGNYGLPDSTAGSEQLHFEFGFVDGEWVLNRVDTDDVGGRYYAAEAAPVTTATLTHPPATTPVVDSDVPLVLDPQISASSNPVDFLTPERDDGNRHHADRAKVVAYAIAHSGENGHAYNSAYKNMKGSDCTNFVSQALEYGGWPMTPRYNGDPTREWWYEGSSDFTSSWSAAQHFYWFVDDNGWAPRRARLADFRAGDVMQVKLGSYHPHEIGHSMIVTKRDGRGNLFLTYHTDNHENTPYADFLARANTKVTVYGWSVG